MSRGGTWPGIVAVEPLSKMDSAGSCDSAISINSGFSDDSMEYLSPEERACLMFLEETIEALEVQVSGLSNDQLDSAPKEEQMTVNDVSSLVPASRNRGKSPPLTHISADPAPTLTAQSKTDLHALNQNSEPKSTPASAANMTDTETGEAQTSPPFPDSAAGAAAVINPTDVASLTLNGDHDPKMVTSPGGSSEMDLSIIPPPSDFMDEMDSTLQPEQTHSIPPPVDVLTKPEVDVENELLQWTDSIKITSLSSSVTEDPPSSPPPDPFSSELSEPKSPPIVAPKPKRLPANIFVKSQKTAAVGSGGSSRHAVSTSSDRILMDHQKIRMEALQKLGLLGSQEEPMGLAKSSKLQSKTRQSWAGPSPLISTPTPLSPPMTPSYSHVSIPPPASNPLQSPPTVLTPGPSTLDPDILPAPAAFSDDINPLTSSHHLPAVEGVLDGAVDAPPLTSPLTPPELVKQLTPPKVMDMTSATLECFGVGQSSYTASQKSPGADQSANEEQDPKQLRSSRPRLASLESGKEFSHAKGEDTSGKQPDSHRPSDAHSASQHSREPAKLPRSQGISVLICPQAENEEDRRVALKKLGLLRN
ncbi:specifically androgen-regulated gene protein [Nothobranchius furzeri]|uniref:Specifically androgen-regulated gene protein-like n=1 Tax=Nothobranchius furzeri TaxID=105023 RepID=A0A8C6MMK7_NOTFU|nr:specifically androgen-regulated gene protein [Nothobranchius furzeri]KAF7210027.1 specifically androgen-regulated gene protein-like [Nothobranchius furzeri]